MGGKVRIAVDCDEVLYSWERTARYLLRKVYKGDVNGYDLNKPFEQWVIPDQIGPKAYEWLFDTGVRKGLFRHGHVITGAMLAVRALKAAGHDLVVITHRPENGVRDTLAWIDFNFGAEEVYPWSGVSILSNGEPKTSVKFDLLIDDRFNNCMDAIDAGRDARMFPAAWNRWMGYNWESLVKELT